MNWPDNGAAGRVRLAVAGTVAAVVMGVGMWKSIGRTHVGQPLDHFDAALVAAEIDELQKEGQLLEQRLRVLDVERRLQRLQHELEMAQRFSVSAAAVQQTNATAWTMLLQVADWEQRAITEVERTQLEQLVRIFPKTTAESVAQDMLVTKEVPDALCETRYEYQ